MPSLCSLVLCSNIDQVAGHRGWASQVSRNAQDGCQFLYGLHSPFKSLHTGSCAHSAIGPPGWASLRQSTSSIHLTSYVGLSESTTAPTILAKADSAEHSPGMREPSLLARYGKTEALFGRDQVAVVIQAQVDLHPVDLAAEFICARAVIGRHRRSGLPAHIAGLVA